MRVLLCVLAAAMLSACSPPADAPATAPVTTPATTESATPPPWDAPTDAFEAVEPTIFGIIGAATVWDALRPIGREGPDSAEGSQTVTIFIRNDSVHTVADVLQTGLADDAISDQHLRFEFRRDVDGMYPVNAYRRHKCRRAEDPQQWSTSPCP